jgi:hypothetical protein
MGAAKLIVFEEVRARRFCGKNGLRLREGGLEHFSHQGILAVLEQKTTILWKCLYVLVSLKDSPGWGVRDERQRWGRQPKSWVKYHGNRGQNQRFPSSICVDEALRFPPHHGLRKFRLLFFVRLRREPLDSRTASHLTQGRDIA